MQCDTAMGSVNEYQIESSHTRFGGTLQSFYPLITFSVNNRQYQFTGDENIRFVKGETVPVLYYRSNPTKAFVYTFGSFWFQPLLLLPIIALGAAIIGIGKNGSYWTFYFRKPRVTRIELQKRDDL